MPQQILVVHGGEVFKTYEEYLDYLKNYKVDLEKLKHGGWKDYLQKELSDNYEVIFPQMENYHNAKYSEWRIWIDKFLPFLKDNVILVGASLGGIFLAKYLSENNFPVKIKSVLLIAAPFNDGYLGDFALPNSLKKMEEQAGKIFLYHSKDDPVVPFTDMEKYAQKLPGAEKVIFEDKGHFNSKEFPEFIEKIKDLTNYHE
jgi:predicted alpha/beta hydrolase family esterase